MNIKKLLLFCSFTFLLAGYSHSQVERIKLPSKPQQKYRPIADRLYRAISLQAHYLIGTVHSYEQDSSLKLLTPSIHGEHGIRPNTGTLAGLCFLHRFGKYRSEWVGTEKKALMQEYILPMMRYITSTYDSLPTSDGKCWNSQWQSAHWAYSLGRAAWFVWNDLPETLQQEVCRIVKAEADRFYDQKPPHRYKYDTAAEENAWNSQIFHIASLLMPEDPDRERWDTFFQEWVLSSYLTPSDIRSDSIVSGTPLSSFEGANLYDDYTLENHRIIHPDYMASFILTFHTAVDYSMTGRTVPDFLRFNISHIYDNLKWFSLPDAGLTYPSWQDWRIFRNSDWLVNHLFMAVYANDRDAWHLTMEALECIERMQERHPEGNIYNEKEYFFPSTQHDLILYLSLSWQALHFARNLPDSYTPKNGVKWFENGKIILNKSDKFLHSLSYSNKIMFMPTLNRPDRIFDSYPRNGIGSIREKGADTPLPLTLEQIKIDTNRNSFTVRMDVRHGDAVRASYEITAENDRMFVHETLTALRQCSLSYISTSEFGILNNEHWIRERGQRRIRYGENTSTITALSGTELLIPYEEFSIDTLSFEVSGLHFPIHYRGASFYANARITDILSLNHSEENRSFNRGETISDLKYSIE